MKRQIVDLLLDGDDYVFDGDLEITGNVRLRCSSLIVTGNLFISNPESTFSVYQGDVRLGSLRSLSNLPTLITNGEVVVTGNFECNTVYNNSNIYIGGNSHVMNFFTNHLHVDGNNDSLYIVSDSDVTISGNCDSLLVVSPIINIKGDLITHHESLIKADQARVTGDMIFTHKHKSFAVNKA